MHRDDPNLPQWMKELWRFAPNLARHVESYINELEGKMADEKKVICMECGRPFPVWSTSEKKIECPFCNVVGHNPYYIDLKKTKPKEVFKKMGTDHG